VIGNPWAPTEATAAGPAAIGARPGARRRG
jgi:hypothetical protein